MSVARRMNAIGANLKGGSAQEPAMIHGRLGDLFKREMAAYPKSAGGVIRSLSGTPPKATGVFVQWSVRTSGRLPKPAATTRFGRVE